MEENMELRNVIFRAVGTAEFIHVPAKQLLHVTDKCKHGNETAPASLALKSGVLSYRLPSHSQTLKRKLIKDIASAFHIHKHPHVHLYVPVHTYAQW